MTNPLLRNDELPPFGEIEAAHMIEAIGEILDECRSGIEVLLSRPSPDYEVLVRGREALEDRLHRAWSPVGHLNAVMNSAEIRQAHEACIEMLTAYHTEMGQHRGLSVAYQDIADSPAFANLSQAEQKVVNNALRDFRLAGIDLPEAQQKRFAALSQQISSLNSRFNNNVLDADQAWSLEISDEKLLAGVPENALALMKQHAESRDKAGYLLTLDMPCYLAIVTYCEDRALRQEIYQAFSTRASNRGPNAGEFDNSDIMQELMEARLEQAQILGFSNFAELSVERKMARSTDEVLAFLNNLASKGRPQAERELAEIQAYADKQGGPAELKPWDVSYYAEKLKKASFDVSDEDLRPYFPAPRVLEGMFEVVRRLFDISVSENKDIKTWHPDVLTYDILKNDKVIARFYLDLYARENKRGGAWMDDCRVRRTNEDGSLQLPVAYLTCNFTGPVGGQPALLSHREVVTLFHEFGHGLHHMMTQISAAEVSGINGVAWDAVELPSQFMENFCWQKESLAFISGHYETGEPLPVDMLDNLMKAKNFQAAMMMVRQLEFGIFDFRLHVEFDPELDNQVQQILDEVRDFVAVVKPPEDNAFQHAFSHIFGGGYAAGYYSYKWAEVLSADAFSKFLEDGIFNRQTGEKFLSTILEKGGSEDALDLFIAFRGREPEVEALLRQDGIAA
jgi:oligopeptidase A